MKRAWRIGDSIADQSDIFLQRSFSRSKSISPAIFAFPNFSDFRFCRETSTEAQVPEANPFLAVIGVFGSKVHRNDAMAREDPERKVLKLRDELVGCGGVSEEVARVLEEKGKILLLSYADGVAGVELMNHLLPRRRLALEVLNWRRKLGKCGLPMTPEEYSKGITIAGRTRKVDLALDWFTEAMNNRIKTTSIYNALMGAYMWNGLADKCLSVFQDLKRDADCVPSIVTYNIIISVYGRLMLVDQMEETFQLTKELNFHPDLDTYNNLIGGYMTSWMWDSMENTFLRMNDSPVKPDGKTYLLMLRGYAHSGNLEKMEEIYMLVKHKHVNPELIRAMICAYVKSSNPDRLERIHTLLKLIPKEEYRPWLNVLLITVYAQETRLDIMESSINEAFERRTCVQALRVMHAIAGSYFRCNAVDRLSSFMTRAESAGWRVCRSIYHGMMILYGKQGCLEEVENTLSRIENLHLGLTRKTYLIAFNAYLTWGKRYKAQKVIGLMYKNGYQLPSKLRYL